MFRIAICDDESIFREQFKEILQKYMDERGRTYEEVYNRHRLVDGLRRCGRFGIGGKVRGNEFKMRRQLCSG